MIAQVVIDVGDADTEHHASKQLGAIALWPAALALQDLCDLRIAGLIAVAQAEQRHCRGIVNADVAAPIKAPR